MPSSTVDKARRNGQSHHTANKAAQPANSSSYGDISGERTGPLAVEWAGASMDSVSLIGMRSADSDAVRSLETLSRHLFAALHSHISLGCALTPSFSDARPSPNPR